MRLLKRAIVRLRRWWNPDKLAAELDEELRFHIDMEARDLMRRGVAPSEARRRAEREFGSFERFKDEARAAGALPRFETLWMDVRHTLRQLRLNPGFAAVAVLTLAIGLGANTAIFSVVNAVLLRSLPYQEAAELVVIKEYATERGAPEAGDWGAVSYLNFVDWRDEPSRAEVFEDLALAASGSYLLTARDEPRQVRAGLVTDNYFRLLGVDAALGRVLEPGPTDARDRAVVLSDGLWREVYGSDRGVLGRTMLLDGEPYSIVGVMPPWFAADEPARFWISLTDDNHSWLQQRDFRAYSAFGRLADGVTLQQAQTFMTAMSAVLAEAYPEANDGWSVQVIGLHDDVVGPVRPTLLLLQFAAGTLLLLACANVANLLMARATGRRQETAMRTALGASRGRIVQQLMVESVVLALLGGAAGFLLGAWGARTIAALTPSDIPRRGESQTSVTVFVFALAAALLTGLLFGLVPAARACGGSGTAALRRGASAAHTAGHESRRLRGALIVAEIALSLVLLVAAGLLISSFAYLWGYEAGFEADSVLTLQISPDYERYPEPAMQNEIYRQLYARLRRLPQVEAVGGITRLPVGEGNIQTGVEGQGSQRTEPGLMVNLRPVSGDYFGAMRIPLLAGRSFAEADRDAVMLNELAARELWPGEPPQAAVGRSVRFSLRDGSGPWRPVIGVVGDTRHGGLDPDPRPEIYELHEVRSFGVNVVVMRTRGDPLDVAAAARAAVYAVDAQQPILDIRTMEQVIADSMRRPRFYAALFATFGALALLIAAAGVFAMAAYSTSRRRREIGVRLAVGAAAHDVVRMIVGEGLVLVGIGIVLGLAASLALGRWISGLLYGVGASDPLTIAAAVAVLAVASLFGFWLPARRATRIDPTEALRLE